MYFKRYCKLKFKNKVKFGVQICPIFAGPVTYSTTRHRQMCTDSGSHIRSPQPNCRPPLVLFHQSGIYIVGKEHSGKADQSTLTTQEKRHVNTDPFFHCFIPYRVQSCKYDPKTGPYLHSVFFCAVEAVNMHSYLV